MQTDHKTDGSELAASAALAAGPKYLGDVAFVTRWLRQLAGRVLQRVESVSGGALSPEDAAAADTQEIFDAVDVFTGMDENYTPMPEWNGTPLADYVRAHLGPGAQGDDRVAMSFLFQVFLLKVYGHVGLAINGKLDEAGLQSAIVEEVRSLAWLLTGMEKHDA